MVSQFEGNPQLDPPSLIKCVQEQCDTKEEVEELMITLDGRVYD